MCYSIFLSGLIFSLLGLITSQYFHHITSVTDFVNQCKQLYIHKEILEEARAVKNLINVFSVEKHLYRLPNWYSIWWNIPVKNLINVLNVEKLLLEITIWLTIWVFILWRKSRNVFNIKKYGKNDCLTKHMMTHTGEKPYKCAQCGKKITRMLI